jgi:general secretion pathway protein A
MYERFYGLEERPFDLTPNPRYLFLTAKHREGLSHLHYGVSGSKGITLLIGDAGTGKTTLVHAALEKQREQDACTVYLSNPMLTRAEFFEFLAWGFGLDSSVGESKTRFLVDLTQRLVDRRAAGNATALIIDEAQCLPDDLLEEIRLLANIETAVDKLLPVVLVGQPELADRLNEPSLRQLKQRVALRCVLPALDGSETAAYIANRVRIAGGDSRQLFTPQAIATIFERSRGIPRTISVICDNALVSGFASDERPVGRDLVIEVCRDFDFHAAAPVSGAAAAAAQPAVCVPAATPRESTFF